MDEFAHTHTNAPGSRHPKRHLDVAELLQAGIDVYTTLNIQHVESLADELRAEWHAVHVETTAIDRISRQNRERIWSDLALAERLGARTATIAGASVDEALIRFARDHNITKILVGRSSRAGGGWFRRLAPAEALIRARIPIDLLLVGDDGAPHPPEPPRQRRGRASVGDYLKSAAYVAIATLLGELLRSQVSPTNLVMPYLVAVVLAALRLGRGPAIAAAGLSVLGFDLFFDLFIVPSRLSIAVNDTEYLLTFLGHFLIGVVVSALVARARDRTEAAREREAQTATLFGLSRDLAVAGDAGAIADATVRHIDAFLHEEAMVLVARGALLEPAGAAPSPETEP